MGLLWSTNKGLATLTAVNPAGRFGELDLNGITVNAFREKPERETSFISGGFFVLNRAIDNYLTGDDCILEKEPLEQLVKQKQLKAYFHHGFWQCMDTYREQQLLEKMWVSGQAPWKVW